MRCDEIRESLIAWLDGELDAGTSATIDEHVLGCRDCAAEVMALRAIGGQIRRVLGDRPPFDVAQALQGVLATLQREERGDPTSANESSESPPSHRLRGLGSNRHPGASPAGVPSTRATIGRRRSGSRPGWRKASGWLVGAAMAAGLVLVARLSLDRAPLSTPTSRPESAVATAPATAPAVRSARAPAGSAEREPKRDAVARAPETPRSRDAVVAAADQPEGGSDDLGVPEEVLRRPGMFLDIPIVRRLEKLRSLEAVYRQSDEGSG